MRNCTLTCEVQDNFIQAVVLIKSAHYSLTLPESVVCFSPTDSSLNFDSTRDEIFPNLSMMAY